MNNNSKNTSALSAAQQRFVRGELARRQLLQIASRLHMQGIRLIPMKGVLFRHLLYDDPAERDLTDLDLLVHPADFERAASALQTLGYRCERNARARLRFGAYIERAFSRPAALTVDLHAQPATGHGAAQYTQKLFTDAMAGEAPFHRPNILIPAPEHLLVMMALHLRDHGLRIESYQLNDAHRLLRRLHPDLAASASLAELAGARVALELLLDLVKDATTEHERLRLTLHQQIKRRLLQTVTERDECGYRPPHPIGTHGVGERIWRLGLHLVLARDGLLESALSQSEHVAYELRTLFDLVRKHAQNG